MEDTTIRKNICSRSKEDDYFFAQTKTKSIASSLAFVLLFSMQFLRYYNFPGTTISLNFVLCFFYLLLFFFRIVFDLKSTNISSIKKNTKIYHSRVFLVIFFVYFFFSALLNYLSSGHVDSSAINTCIYLLMIMLTLYSFFVNKFSFNDVLSIYSFFVFVVIAIYLFQWVLFAFGIRISFKFPGLTFSDSWAALDKEIFGMSITPCSIFSERSHFCTFLFPYLIISLFTKKTKKLISLKDIFVTVVILSTISGNGVVVCGIIWIFYFLVKAKNKKKVFFTLLTGAILSLIVFLVLYSIPAFKTMFSQLFGNTSDGQQTYSKADYRIYRGFDLFFKLPNVQKVFGVGYNQMESFALSNNIVSIYDRSYMAYEYFNFIAGVLIYSGFFGFTLFSIHFLFLYCKSSAFTKCLLITFLALAFSSSLLFTETHLFYYCIIVFSKIMFVPCHEQSFFNTKSVSKAFCG